MPRATGVSRFDCFQYRLLRGIPGAGGLGGKKEYMKYLAAGLQSGGKSKHKKIIGGTMAANPLLCLPVIVSPR